MLFLALTVLAQDLTSEISNSLSEGIFKNFSGKLFTKKTSENTFMVCLQEPGKSVITKSFVVMNDQPLTPMSASESDQYSVIIPKNKRFLLLYNTTTQSLTIIGVKNAEHGNAISQIEANKKLSSLSVSSQILGYGLSFISGTWSIEKIKQSPYKLPYNTLDYSDMHNTEMASKLPSPENESLSSDPPADCSSSACTSGGEGATSCSTVGPLNECSVTCSAGYYACCNDTRVKCNCCRAAN